MGILSKTRFEKMELSFYFVEEEIDVESGAISIEACGTLGGIKKYFYMSFMMSKPIMYDNGDYDEMIDLIKSKDSWSLELSLKYKKDKLLGFSIEKETLCKSFDDQRFNNIEILFLSIDDNSSRNNKN